MKRCFRCGRELPLADFARNRVRKDGLNGHCRQCQAIYMRAHYNKTSAAYKARAKFRNARIRVENRALIRGAKDRPCADCGIMYPYWVMDLDHLPGTEKVAGLAKMHSDDPAAVAKEIAKTQAVCANCHRQRTYKRRAARRP